MRDLCFSMASMSCDSTRAGCTRFAQASSCIWRRLGRLPSRHAFGSCLMPSRDVSAAPTSTSSRNHDTSVHRCNAFSSSILSGFAAPTSTTNS